MEPDKHRKFCMTVSAICPNSDCQERIIYCIFREDRSLAISRTPLSAKTVDELQDKVLLFPKTKKRKEFPPDSGIPDDFIEDYEEAAAVLDISPNASAALSRRLLQRLLRDKAGVKPSIIDNEIKEAIDIHQYPSWITNVINNVKSIGKYGTHPNMTAADQIIDVEPKEAEWSLNVLELLFDFHFIGPEKAKRMQNAISKKGSNPKKYSSDQNKKNSGSQQSSNPPP